MVSSDPKRMSTCVWGKSRTRRSNSASSSNASSCGNCCAVAKMSTPCSHPSPIAGHAYRSTSLSVTVAAPLSRVVLLLVVVVVSPPPFSSSFSSCHRRRPYASCNPCRQELFVPTARRKIYVTIGRTTLRLHWLHRLQVLCLNRQQQQPLLELVHCAFQIVLDYYPWICRNVSMNMAIFHSIIVLH